MMVVSLNPFKIGLFAYHLAQFVDSSGKYQFKATEVPIFDGFEIFPIGTAETEIHLRLAGEGPPVLLLHGFIRHTAAGTPRRRS